MNDGNRFKSGPLPVLIDQRNIGDIAAVK